MKRRSSTVIYKKLRITENKINLINETMRKTDSDMYEHFALMELETLEHYRSALLKELQATQMREWNL